jgi:hypothetical protein
MELGVRERISLVGVVVLICVWYSYKRPFSQRADGSKEKVSTDEGHVSDNLCLDKPRSLTTVQESENRPPIDILYPNFDTPDSDEAEVE